MNHSFPRIITLLRKEKGLSQKSVAEQLGISQALLSHYEKGVRECGLDFIVRIADFYDVSADYLLGRTPNRHNQPLSMALGPDSPSAQAVSPLLASRQRVIIPSPWSMTCSIGIKTAPPLRKPWPFYPAPYTGSFVCCTNAVPSQIWSCFPFLRKWGEHRPTPPWRWKKHP